MSVSNCYWNKEDGLSYEDSSYKNKLNGWVNDIVDGRLYGRWLYKDGKDIGTRIWYYETGEIQETMYALNEKEVDMVDLIDQSEPQVEVVTSFHKNGLIKEVYHLVNNRPRGIVSTYDDQGVLVQLTDWTGPGDCETPTQVWKGEALKEKILMDEVNNVL